MKDRVSDILVSVTIPAYNAERYFRECLDSLMAQTLKEAEFIIVDDGSTDSTLDIAREYAERDSRFRVIHQENRGSAGARQTGLNASRGVYVTVCDADDWVEPCMYSRMLKEAREKEADIVMCQCCLEFADGSSRPLQAMTKSKDWTARVNEMMCTPICHATWTKLIRRDLLEKGGVGYEAGINMGEDCLLFYKLIRQHPVVAEIPDVLYHYRRAGSGSVTSSLTMDKIRQSERVQSWLRENYDPDLYRKGLYTKYVNHLFSCYNVEAVDKKYFREALSRMRWRDFFGSPVSVKSVLVYGSKLLPYGLIRGIVRKLSGIHSRHKR